MIKIAFFVVTGLIILLFTVDYSTALVRTDNDLEHIRKRVISELMEPDVDKTRIDELLTSIQADGRWPSINYDDISRTNMKYRNHIMNLVELARAYRKSGSELSGDEELGKVIDLAVEFWVTHDFISDNWFSNELANPLGWVRFLLIMDESLTQEQSNRILKMATRANLNAWGARPGGDMIRISNVKLKRALYERNDAIMRKALNAVEEEINFTSGRGIKPDYSFNHREDLVVTTASYGINYASAAAVWARRLANTEYSLSEESLELLIDFFLDGIIKTSVHGRFRDPGALNRHVARPSELASLDPETPNDLLTASTYRADELQNIVAIRTGQKKPNLSGNQFFWHAEYFSHQRPGYFTSVRMFSDRNHNVEYPHNQQGLKHHHLADGSNFISRTGEEYKDIFVVWDWQKIPGTTVVQKPAMPDPTDIVKRGQTEFVGGVSDGSYGVAVMDFESPHDPLSIRKSWFFFDDEWVSLGADIQSTAHHPVATTLNQCLLNGVVSVHAEGSTTVLSMGDHKLNDVSWVHHDNIAYLFTEETDVSLQNMPLTGSWREINRQAWTIDAKTEEKDVFSLWIDHGYAPVGETYEYIIVLGIKAADIEAYKTSSGITILSNTPEIQAVQHDELNQYLMVFYEPGSVILADNVEVAVRMPGLVLIEYDGDTIDKITVADPSRRLDVFHLKVTANFEGSGSEWKAVWNSDKGYSDVYIMLPDGVYAGKSVTIDGGQIASPETPPDFGKLLKNMADDSKAADEKETKNDGFYIGQEFDGGVIFWIDETGNNGLIAAKNDQSDGVRWHNGPARVTTGLGDHYARTTNARGDGIGAGDMNTQIIVAQLTEDNFDGNFAAKVCVEYQGGGYGDWYLPSKIELNLMYKKKEKIGSFQPDMYWSSTEYNIGFAWNQFFHGYGGQFTTPKSISRVRCIRKF